MGCGCGGKAGSTVGMASPTMSFPSASPSGSGSTVPKDPSIDDLRALIKQRLLDLKKVRGGV